MEDARKTVADFIGCDDPMQIIFTRGATDSLNQVAFGYAAQYMQKGRKVIVTEFEHHSNFVPWQQAAKRTGAEFVVIPMREDGRLGYRSIGTGTGRVRGDRFGDCNLQCDRNGTSGA
ncbi:MAG: aminotransferase class V-fold PLP-dependent enzyme [Eubacterium ramulus]